MTQRSGELIPVAVRIAVRNAVGGWGPFTVREIDDLFNSHEFFDEDESTPLDGGERRTAAERFQRRIDWRSPDEAQRYLDLVAEVLDYYPEADDQPGSPGRKLRLALRTANFARPDGRLRLPDGRPSKRARDADVADIWVPADQLRVFWSHSSENRADVDGMAQTLEALKCSCFVAHVDIEPSLPWQRTIERALHSCHVMVAYVTPEFKESAWTDQEVGWVMSRGVPVIPVSAGLQPYGFFGSFQSVPAAAPSLGYAVFRAIVIACTRERAEEDPTRAALTARTVVTAFCDSGSYATTRARFPLLSLIPNALWTGEMLEDLQMAAEGNNQISEAGLTRPYRPVPDEITKLVSRIVRGLEP